MPSLHHDPQRFQGWGNWIEHADIQQAKKDLSIFASPGWLQPFFFFFSSCSHLFITMLFPGPAAVSILIKANHPTNRCSWSCPVDSCQGMWSLSWGDLPLPNPLLRFQSRACVLGQLMSVCVFRAWHLSWHHGLKLVGVVGWGGPTQDRGSLHELSAYLFISSFCFFQEIHHLIILCHQVPLATIWKYFIRISLPDCFR